MSKSKLNDLLNRISTLNFEECISNEVVDKFNEKSKELEEYINNINVNNAQNEEDFNTIHEEANKKWAEYHNFAYYAEYNFNLFEEEVDFIIRELMINGVYNHENILLAERFYNEWLQVLLVKPEKNKAKNYHITIAESVKLHALLKDNTKVKGIMSEDFIIYSGILKRIGAISKVWDKMEKTLQDLSVRLRDRLSGLEEKIFPEATDNDIQMGTTLSTNPEEKVLTDKNNG